MQAADFLGSTSRLLDYVATDESQEFIVATEEGIIHEMKKLAPNKKLIPALVEDESCNCSECFFMKRNTLEKIDRKSTRLNSSHVAISYAVFCLKKKKDTTKIHH